MFNCSSYFPKSNIHAAFSGLGWSYPCDLWSVGCILVEFCLVSHPVIVLYVNIFKYMVARNAFGPL